MRCGCTTTTIHTILTAGSLCLHEKRRSEKAKESLDPILSQTRQVDDKTIALLLKEVKRSYST